jgi:hypothetical protein
VINEKQDKQKAAKAKRKSKNIYEGKFFISPKKAQGTNKVVFDHACRIVVV